MKIDHLPQTIRVWCEIPGATDFYALILPDPRIYDGYRDFYLIRDDHDDAFFMFGCKVGSDEEAARIAQAYFPWYTGLVLREG